jgi:hypothetical protein
MLQRLKKEKIEMNVDRQVKDIESELRTKQQHIMSLPHGNRSVKDEHHLYLFKLSSKSEHLAFKKLSECEFPLR